MKKYFPDILEYKFLFIQLFPFGKRCKICASFIRVLLNFGWNNIIEANRCSFIKSQISSISNLAQTLHSLPKNKPVAKNVLKNQNAELGMSQVSVHLH